MFKCFNDRRALTYAMVIAIVVLAAVPTFAQSSSTVDLDASVFISAINTWLPMALSIGAIGVGIAGAFALMKYVGKMIIDAFNGRVG